MERRIKVGITIGDYNGVGPEIIVRLLEDDRIFKFCDIVVYGQKPILNFYAKALKAHNFQTQEVKDTEKLNPKIGNVVNCFEEQVKIEPGIETAEAGKYALICLDKAIADVLAKEIDVLVTGPVNKNMIAQHEPNFHGQTEYIAEKTGGEKSLMLLADENLRIGLATNHVPVKDVAQKIDSVSLMQKLELFYQSLQKDYLINKPRIAVLGLNPHSGDGGLIGKEEKDIIAPTVQKARDKGMITLGPFAADGFFGTGNYMKFDGVLAMYHDQGLVPFKTISFNSGVNFTAGLKVIRTSPDHGTGYDIAGKNMASCDSLRAAVFMGIDIHKNRLVYTEMTANPVEKVRLNEEREG